MHRSCRRARPGLCRRARSATTTTSRHHDLLAVRERRREVYRGLIRATREAAGTRDGVRDALTLLKPIETGSTNGPDDVHHDEPSDRGSRLRRSGARRSRRSRRRLRRQEKPSSKENERNRTGGSHQRALAGEREAGHLQTMPGKQSRVCDRSVSKA
jgi:hypothetical protein